MKRFSTTDKKTHHKQTIRSFSKSKCLIWCLWVAAIFPVAAQNKPILLPDDILTFSGGAADSRNPDIYTIDMGVPDLSHNASDIYYPVTIQRPKGASANYPVTIFYEFNSGSMSVVANVTKNQSPHSGGSGTGEDTLHFPPGVAERQLFVHIPSGGEMRGTKEALYVFFSPLTRTKTEQSVLELVFTNPAPPEITTAKQIEYGSQPGPILTRHGTDQYALIKIAYFNYDEEANEQYAEITEDQKLVLTAYHIDHNTIPEGSPEMDNADFVHEVRISPRLPNTTHSQAVFLYKLTEEAIITDYQDDTYPSKTPVVWYKLNSIVDIKQAVNGNLVNIGFRNEIHEKYGAADFIFNFHPRFGTVQANKTHYNKGEVVTLNIPFENANLYQKVFGSDWRNHIFITLDGGETFLPNHPGYNATTKHLTISFNAPNESGGEVTLYPEVCVRRHANNYYDQKWFYPQGGFTSIRVSNTEAPVVFTESITVSGLPEKNRDFIEQSPHTVLEFQVSPSNCSFLNAVWTSSDPDILEVTATGELIPKQRGTVTLTLTSDEAAYRNDNQLPAKDDLLKKTFSITVKNKPDIEPVIESQRKLAYEAIVATFDQNIRESGWAPIDKPCQITITHSDPEYQPIQMEAVLTEHLDTNGLFTFEIPFSDRTFPRRNSAINPNNSLYMPACNVAISVAVADTSDTQDTLVLTSSSPVYILPYVYPRIVGYSEKTVVKETDDGTIKARFSIEHLDKQFVMEMKVMRVTCNAFTDELVPGSQELVYSHLFTHPIDRLPIWVTLEDMGDTYKSDIKLSLFAHNTDVPEGMYFKYICDLYVRSLNLPRDKGSATARSRICVYNPNFEEGNLEITYRTEGDQVSLPLNEENWKTNNAELLADINQKLEENIYSGVEDLLNSFGHRSSFKVIDRLEYPDYWGPCVIKVYHPDGGITSRTVKKDQLHPIYLKFPQPDSLYRFSLCFPDINAEKIFTYKWTVPDMENIRLFSVKRSINLPTNLTLKYDGKERTINIQGTGVTYFNILSNENKISLYPDVNFFETYILTKPNKFTRVFEMDHYSKEMEVGQNVLDIKWFHNTKWFSLDRAYESVNLFTEHPNLKIQLFDEEGQSIQTNAHVNYMVKRANLFFTEDTGTEEAEDGFCKISFEDMSTSPMSTHSFYRVYVEVIAEGYNAQVAEFNFIVGESFGNYDDYDVDLIMGKRYYSLQQKAKVILKKSDRMYSRVELVHTNPAHAKVLMTGLSLYSYTPYKPAEFDQNNNIEYYSYLDMSMVWNYPSPPNLTSSSLPKRTWTPFVSVNYDKAEFTQFENTYINLSCLLYKYNNEEIYFSNPQENAFVYVCHGNDPVCQLPGLRNADPVPEPVDFNVPAVGDVKTDQAENGANLRESKKNFKDFNIETLESLPFCMHVTKNGNEWIVRGAVEIDVFSKDFGANKVNDQNFKEKFNTMKNRLKYGSDYGKTSKGGSIKATVGGYVEGKGTYNPATGKLENISFSAGGISIEASAEVSLKKTYLVGEFGVALAGSLATSVDFYKSECNTETFNIDLVFDNRVSLSLRAWAQIGFDAWFMGAVLGVSGSASVGMTHRLERKADGATRDGLKFDFSARIDMYARAWLGPFEHTWDKNLISVHKTFLQPDNESNPFNNPIGNKSAPRTKLVSKHYLAADIRSVSPDLNSIIPNIHANASPRYIDQNTIMFNNINQITNLNDDRIQWYSGGSSTDIDPLSQTAAYNFDAASASGKRVVVYEQLKNTISENELDSMGVDAAIDYLASTTQIMAAVDKGSGWIISPLSDNNYANMSPKVAFANDGNKAAAIWISGKMTIREVSEDDNSMLREYLKGELLMSRYNGNTWSKPSVVTYLDENFQLSEYQPLLIGDTLLIVAINQSPLRQAIAEDQIVTLFVPNDTTAFINNMEIKGRNPQIKRIGNENIITILTPVEDTTGIAPEDMDSIAFAMDVYLMAVDNEGIFTNGLSGYLGLNKRNIQNYRLVADENPAGINSLSVLWHEPSMIYSEENPEEFTIHTKLFAAKLGRWNSRLFASAPFELVTAPADYWISSYDAHTNGANVKTAVVIANQQSGAEIIEETSTFTNTIDILDMTYVKSDLIPGMQIPVEFWVENKGYAPVTDFEIVIANDTTNIAMELMPGQSNTITGYYNVPFDALDMNYHITATFAEDNRLRSSAKGGRARSGLRAQASLLQAPGNGIARKTGQANLTIVDMGVRELSNLTEKDSTSVVLEVINNSPFRLNTETVKVGLYKDPYGDEIYPGTEIKTIAGYELYDTTSLENLSIVVPFKIPTVFTETLVYAIISTTTDADETIEDQETIDNFTIIRLYPDPRNLAITTTALPDGTKGLAYNTALETSGTTLISWKMNSGALPDGLTLADSTGIISGIPLATGTFNFSVIATNGIASDTAELSLTINENTIPDTITILTQTLPDGTVGLAYDATLEAQSTNTSPINWNIVSATLPDGLNLNGSTGLISGIPTHMGTFEFVVIATDGNVTDTAELSILINDESSITQPIKDQNELEVIVQKDGLLIKGLVLNENLSIYNLDGQLLFHKKNLQDTMFYLPWYHEGIYIVINGPQRTKVIYFK